MLPSTITNSIFKVNTISELIEAFKDIVNKLDDFWNLHEEIINTCHVIGHYTYKDVTLKIPISNFVYISVEIDVYFPNNCPKFNFYGQSKCVEKFQLRFNEINPVLIWNSKNTFKENILNIFGITDLPQQCVENNAFDCCAKDVNNCLICYDQLDTITEKQIKKCVNTKCDALYHMTCISEWLLACDNKPMFDYVQGKCPQCDEELLIALENFDLIKTLKNTSL